MFRRRRLTLIFLLCPFDGDHHYRYRHHFRRSRRKVHAASWLHDGSATGGHQVGFGTTG